MRRAPLQNGRRSVLVGALLTILGGCAPSTDPAKFQAQVEQWVPIGATAAEAANAMGQRGFDVLLERPERWLEDQRDYLFCGRERMVFFLVEREWRAILIIDDARVVEIETFIFYTGP